jgi:hypothetical protein
MPANYVLLQRIELNASAASVTFSNIPQSGYTDLKVVLSARSDRATEVDDQFIIKPNNSTSNLTYRFVRGNGSTASSDVTNRTYVPASGSTASTFGNAEIYIPNYTSSVNKSFYCDSVQETNATGAFMSMQAILWSDTTAISSLVLAPVSGTNFVQYSTFSLYGLAAVGTTPVIAPKASGGNITTDGTYWYHTFLSSGTFTPATGLTCDALVVAGGGGGGTADGSTGFGGGGAGGLLTFTSQSFSTAQTITVGAGGAAGANGANSQLGSLTATIGGGRGGNGASSAGASGGSGGGGSKYGTVGGSGTSGQGNAGGGSSYNEGGGGGGGAGAAGTNAIGAYAGGTGGIGATSALINAMGSATTTGELYSGNYYYAGGGGGYSTASGGGGGGKGGGGTNNVAGFTNTGGGGGYYTNALAGGSGIIIVRYLVA